ncbi:type II toxin-antitoxin system RelE/ParE family toxin [Mesorhizobium sp. M0862]|uniref:type II toxin-antitoxin system RelE/ParE family toxin n=1 Tax=Mesorhizobium sp. M0862 TaxID=2957015 RepID=UPI003339ABB4
MTWEVVFGDEFDGEFEALPQTVQDELLASAKLLGVFGPQLGRPHADTLNDSSFANMKELRFDADDGVWHCVRIRLEAEGDPARRRR